MAFMFDPFRGIVLLFFVLLATHQFFITYVQHFINRSVT